MREDKSTRYEHYVVWMNRVGLLLIPAYVYGLYRLATAVIRAVCHA
jgi:hypothetical protein